MLILHSSSSSFVGGVRLFETVVGTRTSVLRTRAFGMG